LILLIQLNFPLILEWTAMYVLVATAANIAIAQTGIAVTITNFSAINSEVFLFRGLYNIIRNNEI